MKAIRLRRQRQIGLTHPPGGVDPREDCPRLLDQHSPCVGIGRPLEPTVGQEGLAQLGKRLDALEDLAASSVRSLGFVPAAHGLVDLPQRPVRRALLQRAPAALSKLEGQARARQRLG